VPVNPTLFQVLARVTGQRPHQGRQLRAETEHLAAALLTQLVRGEFAQEAVTIIEGWTFRQMREAIDATKACATKRRS
jgi:UPF0755 protein